MKGIVWTGAMEVTDQLEVRQPASDEVLVRIVSAGVCHSDVSVVNGTIPFPTPTVMGHEGAGIVEAVGDAVTMVAVGDHVVVITMEYCGACAKCDTGFPTLCLNQTGRIMNNKPFSYKGEPAMAFANSAAFAEYTVVRQNQTVKIPDDISFEVASLLGCGVMTGVGAVFNRAKVERGSTCAVIGMGGIGLNALQACKAAGASVVIGIDALASKESFAREFGATHFINGAETDALEEVRKIVPRGVDYSFECVGFPKLTRQAIDMLAPGGISVGVGTNPRDAVGTYDPNTLYLDKTIMGCRYGSSKPHRDIPLFIDMYRSGMLKFDELVSKTYPMEDIQQVFDDMKTGTIARGVLTISAP